MPVGRNEIVPVGNVTIIQPSDRAVLKRSVRGPARLGLFLIVTFVAGFGAWAAFVPLASGAIAPGVVSPDGSRRTVQHLEGGIIRTLHVRDGDLVEKGQPLLVLESVQPRANHDMQLKQQRTLRITKTRLDAERLGKDELEFAADLLSAGPEIAAIMSAQRELFTTRRASHESKNRILRQRTAQLREQIKGFEAQVKSASRQIEYLEEELVGKRDLAQKGYLAKPELLRMLRMEAELAGRQGQYEASISEAQQQIGEAELQLLANEAARADQIATQLDQVQAELNALEEKLMASRDVLNRTVITAPVSGTIVNLKFKTVSGVIQPGVPILDIVPADEKLLIEARIAPTDIDVVHAGLKAQVQFTAFASRSAPRIDGLVRSVSADRMVDEVSKKPFYLARVEVEREEVARLGPNIELVPGMPADVLVVTGERTLANYLLRPFLDSVWRTLREV
jgi:HlyD family secretion protein/epimerase transport system membrane fusion protein